MADGGLPGVIRVKPDEYNPADPGANQSVVVSGSPLSGPRAIAIEADGKLVIGDSDAHAVFRVDPANSTISSLASSSDFSSFGTGGIDVVRNLAVCAGTAPCGEAIGDLNVGSTPDLDPSHPEIWNKAHELGTPLGIFKFVRNEIKYEVYFGSKKGALGTLRSRSGNDYDQASLLIALFRALGLRARYAVGLVEVDVDQLMQWSGVRDASAAGEIFFRAYCDNDPAFGLCATTPIKRFELLPPTGTITAARLEHAWVEVELPGSYRGLGINPQSPPQWIALDPAWKQKSYRDPIPQCPPTGPCGLPILDEATTACGDDDLCFPYSEYYSKVDPRLASEIWEQRVREWIARQPEFPPGTGVEAAIYDGPIIPYEAEVLPLALPFVPQSTPPVQSVSDLDAIGDGIARRFRMSIGLENSQTGGSRPLANVAFAEVVGKRLTLAFEPRVDNGLWGPSGGPFGTWPGGKDSILAYCAANPSDDQNCLLVDSLRLEGRRISPGYLLNANKTWHAALPMTLHVVVDRVPGSARDETYTILATDFLSIGLDANQSSEAEVTTRVEALERLHRDLRLVDEGEADLNGNGTFGELLLDSGAAGIVSDLALDAQLQGGFADALVGELLHLATLRYSLRYRLERDRVLALDGLVASSAPQVHIAKAGRSYTYLFGQPVGVEPGAPIFDLKGLDPPLVDIDGDPVDNARALRELRLWSHTASSLEHQVWEELIGSEFVSTVKGIQLVRERYPGTPLLTFTAIDAGHSQATNIADALHLVSFDTIGVDTIGNSTLALIQQAADGTPPPGIPGPATEKVVTPQAAVSAQGDRVWAFTHELTAPGIVGVGMKLVVNATALGGSCSIVDCTDPFRDILDRYDLNDVFSARETAQGFGSLDVDDRFTSDLDVNRTIALLAGDPVSVVSGNLSQTEEDLRIPTDGPPFVLTRTYNSQIDEEGALGVGWTHSYEARLQPPNDLQEFTYLPKSLVGFGNQSAVEAARSDAGDTRSTAGSSEKVDWNALPSSFTSKVTVDSIALEIAYNGEFGVNPGTGQAVVQLKTSDSTHPGFERIELKTAAGAPYTSLGALEVVLGPGGSPGFDGTDVLYFARLRIRYRGAAIRRIDRVLATSGAFTNWPSSSPTDLTDEDPSTCVAPSATTGTINYAPSTAPNSEVFGHEFLVAVKRATAGLPTPPNSKLYMGTTSGEPFGTGPGVDGGVRERFITPTVTNTVDQLTFDSGGSTNKVELCHIVYRALTLPEQLDFVREDGARERFTKVGGVWQAAPGVRSRLTELVGSPKFKLTRPDGSSLSFDQVGGSGPHRLQLVSDAQNRSLQLQYNTTTNRLEKVIWLNSPEPILDNKEALVFFYDGNGKLDKVQDWTGRTWDYTVTNGDLVEARDPEASFANQTGTRYEYDSGTVLSGTPNLALKHNLRRIILPQDENGDGEGDHWTRFEYDNADRVSSYTDSLGNRQTFSFDVPRQESRATDARGLTTIYRHDLQGNLLQRVDPDGATWTWTYDDNRNVLEEIDPLGHKQVFSGYDALGSPGQVVDRDDRSTQFTYHSLTSGGSPVLTNLPAIVTDKRGHDRTTAYTTDGLPLEVTQELVTLDGEPPSVALLLHNDYDATSRRLDRTVRPLGDGTGRQAITRFIYFPGNRDVQSIEQWEDNGDGVLNASDRLLSQAAYTYDGVGRKETETIVRQKAPDDPTPISLTTQWVYNRRDQVESILHPDKTKSVFVYNRNRQLEERHLEETPPAGGTPKIHQQVLLRYDAIDRLVEAENALGQVTSFGYDANGNRTAVADPLGNTSQVEYDALNRPVREIDANGAVARTEYDAVGRPISKTDPTGLATQMGYDEIGRLVSYQRGSDPAARRTVTYDLAVLEAGNSDYREVIIDPKANATTFFLDAQGRVTATIDATPEAGRTETEYDLAGNLTRLVDPEGAETKFRFDALGRVEQVDRPYATAPFLTEYDEVGNPIRITKPDTCVLEMTYDRMNRLRHRRSTPSCPAVAVDEQFGYDARGNLVAAKNGDIGLIREYDPLDRLTREIDDRFGTSVGYLYDDAGRLRTKIYPDGSVVQASYDAAGRPTGITDPFGDTTRYVYDEAGRRLQTRGVNSHLVTNLGYDGNGRIEQIDGLAADGSLRTSFTYGDYDAVGNVGSRQVPSGTANTAGETTYMYDAVYRLTAETVNGGDPVDYEYDRAGNRQKSGHRGGFLWSHPYRTYSYANTGPVTHHLTQVLDDDVTPLHSFPAYDAGGNPLQWNQPADSRTLHWDALDRLVEISSTAFEGTYVYDPLGRRIEKTEQGTTTRYQYDGPDVLAEYSSTTLLATYIFGPGIDDPIKVKRAGVVSAYHADGIGSVAAISKVDSTAATQASYEYDAFGVRTSAAPPFANAYTFTGRELDASGLYYYRARYYLPDVGRFLTPDPIGLQGGLNPYGYVGSNPVNFRDPFGLFGMGNRVTPPPQGQVAPTPQGQFVQLAGDDPVAIGQALRQSLSQGGLQPGDITPTMQAGEILRGYDVRSTISKYGSEIEGAAGDYGADANLIRAIIYEEQTHLVPLVESRAAERLGVGSTVGLGQITVGFYGYSRSELLDPATNIRAMGIHLSTMGYFPPIDPASPISSAGTRYNCMSCTSISPYGRRVDFYYGQFSRGIWP